VSGSARVDPNAPDATLDSVLGTTAPGVEYSASGHRAGDAGARASRAFDADPATAWDAPFGAQEGQWIEVGLAQPAMLRGATIRVVADGRHSVPTRVRVEADGTPVATLDIPEVADGSREGASREVPLEFGPLQAQRLRFVIDRVRTVTTIDDRTREAVGLPVGIAELGVEGVPRASAVGRLDDACRDDLVRVDGVPVAVRVASVSGALESCGGPVGLGPGRHTLRSAIGLDTGLDVDRVVLTSGRDGAAEPASAFRAGRSPSGARVAVADQGATTYDLEVRSDGSPFWLVLGQSHSEAWKATLSGGSGGDRSLGAPRLVNGYANGWLVDPGGAGTYEIRLRWTGQNLMWGAFAMSLLAILACIVVVVVTRRRRVPALDAEPRLGSPFAYDAAPVAPRAAIGVAVVAGVAASLASRAWIGLVVGVATLVASMVRGARVVLAGGAPAALVLSRAVDAPELGWLAVLLLAADLLIGCVSHRQEEGRATHLAEGQARP
jgi:hypothetical protein